MKLLNEASEMVDVQALTPHPRNVNIGNMNAITESIHESGFYGGIVAQRSTGFILAGNHRYQAAVQLGATEIPVHWVEIGDKAALKILLADNATAALAVRDDEALTALLSELQLTDTLTGTGYADADLDALIASIADNAPTPEPVEVPEPQIDRAEELREKWQTERGQLWTIPSRTTPGKAHRLLCGDSTDAEDVARLMDGQKADMVWTDPPYGYSYQSNFYKNGNHHGMLTNDDKILDFFPALLPHLAAECAVYVCAGHQTAPKWRELVDPHLTYKNTIIWKKNNWSMGDLQGAYAGQYEMIFFYHRGRPLLRGERSRDVWEFDRDPPENHPTQKPVELVTFALTKSSDPGQLIADVFLGSGTTAVAAEAAARLCYGMELEPKYIAVILERLSGMGLAPELQPAPTPEVKQA